MTEEWRPVIGWEGYYEVSSTGRVRSLTRRFETRQGVFVVRPGTVLRPSTDPAGYRRVCLNGPRRRSVFVHVLVNTAFNGMPPGKRFETRHLDGNPANNRANNLAWGSHAENMQDQIRHGRFHAHNITHCPQGHAYTEENTYIHNRKRSCKTCRLDAQRRYKARLKEKTNV